VGSWGVRAHESDTGLDLLAVAVDKHLCGVRFKTFHVKHVMEIMKAHIIDKFAKESYDWESQYIDFFYEYTFPYKFAHAVMLVAECFAEYRQKGKYAVHDFTTEKVRKRQVKEFIFTQKDLETLLTELRSFLDPQHALYQAWSGSESFEKWKAHIQALCDTLSQSISEGGGGDA